MALYPAAIKKLIAPGPNDPPIKARVVILHVAATEAASLYNYFNGPSGGVESHFYVKYDGSVEQYRDTAFQADANVMANDFAISIETQGLAAGTWTDAQLASIKALIAWCHDTHGVPLVVCPTWDGSGVGYHVLFEDQWDQRHAVCPGPNRVKQFNDVLVPWMASSVPSGDWFDMATQADLEAVVRKVTGIPAGQKALDGADGAYIVKTIAYVRDQLMGQSTAIKDQIAKLNDPAAIAAAIPDNLAQQVVDQLAARLTAKE